MSKEDDVRKYVIRREVPSKKEGKKPTFKAPKIQRLVTPVRLQRKRHQINEKKRKLEQSREAYQEYHKLLAVRAHERVEKRHNRRRSMSGRQSGSSEQ